MQIQKKYTGKYVIGERKDKDGVHCKVILEIIEIKTPYQQYVYSVLLVPTKKGRDSNTYAKISHKLEDDYDTDISATWENMLSELQKKKIRRLLSDAEASRRG